MRAAAFGCWRRRVAGEERAQGVSGRAASGQAPVSRMSGPPRAYTVARAPCVSQKCAQSGDKFSKISHFLTNLCEICGRRREICPSKFEGERGKMLARAKCRMRHSRAESGSALSKSPFVGNAAGYASCTAASAAVSNSCLRPSSVD